MAEFIGYQPADVIAELGSDLPRCALFTTFTFSPGAFQQQYVNPLVQHGCGDITVLADRIGYAQSLFAAAAVQGIGINYRLRQVSVPGAFHGKLVLIRTDNSMIVGVGSGNLTASGLQGNAEVGSLYVIKAKEQLEQMDNLALRLRHLGGLEESAALEVAPITLNENARLLTSLDTPLIDQIYLPDNVRRIEIVSPFVDGQLEVLNTFRKLWPDAMIRLRLDPGFGALDESLLEFNDDRIEVQVPIEPKEDKGDERRPAVHGKLLCIIGEHYATAILGSANLSRPAFLKRENFEAVIERQVETNAVDKLLAIPGIRWRKAKGGDQRSFSFADSQASFSPLVATLTNLRLQLAWAKQPFSVGVARIWCRGRCVFEKQIEQGIESDGDHSWNYEINTEVKDSMVAPSFAEVELDNGKRFRGWVDVADLLGVTPEAKRHLVLLDAIATDPIECDEKDVAKFIEILQRNLKSTGRSHSSTAIQTEKTQNDEYDDSPIQRSLLLESGSGDWGVQSLLLNQLINRSLDTALRDLKFFGRDQAEHPSARNKTSPITESGRGKSNQKDERPLPPKIESVLSQLFVQLATAFDESKSVQEVTELISQIPTCLKSLAYSVRRWIPRSQCCGILNHHFHKVAITCLAPGIFSILRSNGAISRIHQQMSGKIHGGSNFNLGVAMLEAYLLIQFQAANDEIRRVLKDMHDNLRHLPAVELTELNTAGSELIEIERSRHETPIDFAALREQVYATTGELAGLKNCREALHKLIAKVRQGFRSRAELGHLAALAIGAGDPNDILSVIEMSGHQVRLVEIDSDDTACTECHRTLPGAVSGLLNNTKRVWRCSCGVLLVRSLEK